MNHSTLSPSVEKACAKIPPLWPVTHFVAANPFLGLSHLPFAEAMDHIRKVTHTPLLPSMAFYREQQKRGHILTTELHEDHLTEEAPRATTALGVRVLTLADALDLHHGTTWTELITEEISKWCAAYYDQGQASWPSPWRHLSLYAAWKQASALDHTPEILGFTNFRKQVATLPDDPAASLESSLQQLGIRPDQMEDFLHRQLMSLPGWSGHVQYRVREKSLAGETDDSLVQLLAIRVAYDALLHQQYSPNSLPPHWPDCTVQEVKEQTLALRLAWQEAYETTFQHRLINRLKSSSQTPVFSFQRPSVQAVFCIDVRSELFRGSLEAVAPGVETVGFAGFFGFAVEYQPFGESHALTQGPALFKPAYRLRETVPQMDEASTLALTQRHEEKSRVGQVWKSFRSSAVSCFPFVESAGLLFAPRLLLETAGFSTPDRAPVPKNKIKPQLNPEDSFGLSPDTQIQLAEGALRNMGLTSRLGRLVLFCGHGSCTTNNPYGSGLDCGACGGQSGAANARIAATVLNQPHVRAGLQERGLNIPDDTWFLAGVHNTTTDEVTILDADSVPVSHQEDVTALQQHLIGAAIRTRCLRAPGLGYGILPEAKLQRAIEQRSRDWAQVRPEWGLAGNAALIAAPRSRTRGLALEGRAFLHDYDSANDPEGKILELIMTAPMVVASWINLQYFASSANNTQFGSGNKNLHNVVGGLGVCLGNGGDLQVGLPWQSVHDGKHFVHHPLRLSVLIEAEPTAINRILEKHSHVRELVEHQWIHLFAIRDEGRRFFRHQGHGLWKEDL